MNERIILSFLAIDPITGDQYQLHVFEELNGSEMPTSRKPGDRTHIQTSDGKSVSRVKKGQYEVIGDKPVLVLSDDPYAL